MEISKDNHSFIEIGVMYIKLKKFFLVVSMVLLILLNNIVPVFAVGPLESANIFLDKYSQYYLQFSNGNKVRTALVYYNDEEGIQFPAYCLNPNLLGVGDVPDYSVTVSKRLEDEGLWRLIKNAYPYNSLGLRGEEAYFATKQAIYRYLAGDDSSYYGGGGIGETGEEILLVIDDLLDKARNGTEKIIDGKINIETDGVLNTYNDEYYYINYTFSSNAEWLRFYIYLTENVDEKIYVANENGEETNFFGKYEETEKNFRIMIPSDLVNEQIIEFNIKADMVTYPIYIGESPNDDYQDYLLPKNCVETVTSIYSSKIEMPVFGEIILKKIDSKTKDIISNVGFELYKIENEQENLISTKYTDEQGQVIWDLEKGNYVIREINALGNYLPNEEEYYFEILENGQLINLEIENTPVELSCEINKKATEEIEPGQIIEYEISNIKNTSNTYLENFAWEDVMPENTILQTLNTGTYNEDLRYKVLYKTNKSEDYIFLKEVLTTENSEVDFTHITLSEDEYITNVKMLFDKVEVGFSSVESPIITVKSSEEFKKEDIITNKVIVEGVYGENKTENFDEAITIVYEKEVIIEEPPIEVQEEEPDEELTEEPKEEPVVEEPKEEILVETTENPKLEVIEKEPVEQEQVEEKLKTLPKTGR